MCVCVCVRGAFEKNREGTEGRKYCKCGVHVRALARLTDGKEKSRGVIFFFFLYFFFSSSKTESATCFPVALDAARDL